MPAGHETQEAREAVAASLIRERDHNNTAIAQIQAQLEAGIEGDQYGLQRAVQERELTQRKEGNLVIEAELKSYQGSPPQKRAQKRA
jgi:hypothetical protein